MPEFKVGDKVKLKPGAYEYHIYGGETGRVIEVSTFSQFPYYVAFARASGPFKRWYSENELEKA